MQKKLTLLLGIFTIGATYAECLDSLLPAFKNNSIMINGTKNKYKLSDNSGKIKQSCAVSAKELEKFISKNFISYSGDKNIVASWNYLAINKKAVYDYLKTLKEIDDNFSDSTTFQLYGVVNNSFACYKYSFDNYVSGSAHPNEGFGYYCSYPGATYVGDKVVNIAQVIEQNDLVTAIKVNKDVAAILKQLKIAPNKIKTLAQLKNALSKNEEMACVLSTDIPQSFAITKVNADETINALYSLGANAPHVCQGVISNDIVINNVKPKIKINSFITPTDLRATN